MNIDLDWSAIVAPALCAAAFAAAIMMIFGTDRSFYRFVWLIPAGVAATLFAKLELGIDVVSFRVF